MNILDKIDELRRARGWSYNRLAEEAALTQSTVAHMFSRGTMPSLTTLQNICEALGISMAQFFADTDEAEFLSAGEKALVRRFRALSDKQKEAIMSVIASYE